VAAAFPGSAGQTVSFNGMAYFLTGLKSTADTLWKSDWTAEGTVRVPPGGQISQLTVVDHPLMYATPGGIWYTASVGDAQPAYIQDNLYPEALTASGGQLFFGSEGEQRSWTAYAPSAPPALLVTGSGAQPVLNWRVPLAISPISAFVIERKIGPGGSYAIIADLPATVNPFVDTAAQQGGWYYYRVRAVNAGGSSPSIEVSSGSAVISGSVFGDTNHNGSRDAGEVGQGEVLVYVDVNRNGKLDSADLCTTTAPDGTHSLTGLPAGTYTVREVVPAGYAITSPLGYAGSVAVANGQGAGGPVLGNMLISGVKLDFSYLVILARQYGQPGTFASGDQNADGSVGFDDLVILARNYGKSISPTTAAAAVFSVSLVSTTSSPSLPAAASDLAEAPPVHALRH